MDGMARDITSATDVRNPMRVFVLLAHGFGARRWAERWARGEIPGINERLPYGYFHCASDRCEVEYSEDASEYQPTRFARMCMRRLLGFDLIHAWRNRAGISAADVVWTHTEFEYLALLLLFRLGLARTRRPKLIAQSVWLFDRWRELSRLKRWTYSRLIEQADILTVLSPDNLHAIRELFPNKMCEFVPFGIDTSKMRPARRKRIERPVRLLSLGNDMHRDWGVLVEAFGGWSECHVRIGVQNVARLGRATCGFSNVEILKPVSAAEVECLYEWADIVVVPLKRNFHVSGITVVTEAMLFGVPVICTDTGGLRGYFSDEEVRYVPIGEPESLRAAIEELLRDDDLRFSIVKQAQARIVNSNRNSRAFAYRHYELSRLLLGRPELEPRQAKVAPIDRPPHRRSETERFTGAK